MSRTSGSDGGTLVTTGDPTGLKNGDTRSGQLTFTTTINGYTQTWQVPVSLIRGDVYQDSCAGPMPSLRYVYLPIVLK